MFGTHDIWLFVISGLLLNITPGPDTLYIVGRSSTQGWLGSAGTSNPLAFLFLGAIFDINGTLWNLLMARLAAQISSTLAPSVAFKQWFNRCVGGVFVLVGLRLALADER
jgi:threonine/homoserine/homoserine lactone efflux protein